MPGVIAEQPVKARKPTKNEQRRAKKKQHKHEVRLYHSLIPNKTLTRTRQAPAVATTTSLEPEPEQSPPPEVDANHPIEPTEPSYDDPIQDVPDVDDPALPPDDPLYTQFADVFTRFAEEEARQDPSALVEPEKPEVFYDDDENVQDEEEEAETKKQLSKKARKAAAKLSIAELKAIVRKPEIVEWTDPSASNPKLLVNIKSARNIVPVPHHWNLKREYLSSKRGIEKPGFALPQFIAETGISDMRDAVLEKEAEASLKSRQRDRVQPKMGKLDIDYQKLYEAFFRRQTKPQLTRYGEVYYEGKEYETNLRHLRPGEFSEELLEALNMPPGSPAPWLINQQKFGPPPSYPAQKIPGLNTPLPAGGQWGFHVGGYGKPALTDDNRPMWGGDLFGLHVQQQQKKDGEEERPAEVVVDKSLWGELVTVAEEEPEEDDEDEDDDEDGEGTERDVSGMATTGLQTPFGGTETPGGITSTVPTDFGHGTASMAEEFNLRKQRRGTETEESHHPRSAGQVLQERAIRAEGFFGGERAYDINPNKSASSASRAGVPDIPMLGSEPRGAKRKAGDLDVSVDVDALEREDRLSKDEVRRQYEMQRQQAGGWQGGGGGVVDQEDLSQMIAEESAKRRRRDEKREEGRRGGGRR